MLNKHTRYFGSESLRNRLEGTFPGVVFVASTIFYVGGSISRVLSNTPTVG